MQKNLILETHNLCKSYKTQTILSNVNMHIEKGKIYGLLGRNGAGKTSIMKMLLGLTSVSSGSITAFDKPLHTNSMASYAKMGSLIEAPGFYPNLSGTENLKIFSILKSPTRKNAVKEVLDFVNLPYNDKKPFASYSLGMKQRLGLANALMNEPELLILDEPTNGLDPIGIAELRNFILDLSRKQGKTIIISSHQLSEMEQLVDTVGVLHNTNLIEECDITEITKNSPKYITIQVSDIKRASHVLEKTLKIQSYRIAYPDTLCIFDVSHMPSRINRVLLENEVEVLMLNTVVENLEEHFKAITGGVGIA